MMRTVTPGTTAGSGGDPAAISPMTGNSTGESCRADATSSARTAYPSIAEFGSGGMEIAERTSSDEHETVGVGKRDTLVGSQWPNISQNAL